MVRFFIYCTIVVALYLFKIANADSAKLSVPRFVSIKSNEVNARTGPHPQSSIEWIFVKKGEPVEITEEYEHWRLVRDINSDGGWIHASVLSAKRFVIITGNNTVSLLSASANNSKVIAKIAPGVRCQLYKATDSWCKIQCAQYKGWVQKNLLWGVYANEKL